MEELKNKNTLDRDLKIHLDAIALEEGLQNITYAVTSGSSAGDNYIGVIHRITLIGDHGPNTTKVTKNLIYKCQPDNESRRNIFRTAVYFRQEAQFYNQILPTFCGFQEERGLTEQGFSSCPSKCYHAGDVLILEDMRPQGFEMCDRKISLDVEHCKLVLRELGKFHALSFAMRDQKPEVFKKLMCVVEETLFIPMAEQTMHEHCYNSAGKATDKFVETSVVDTPRKEIYEANMRKFQKEYYASMVECVAGENAEPYAVYNHGDCWTNNLLFKYSKDSTIPKEVCFIDFQLGRYASPANDIAYFLYCCTDQELRQKHHQNLMIEYHNSLSCFLKELGSDPEEMFPFSAFEDQLRRFSKFGLGMAILTIPLFTCEAEDLPDFDAVSEDDTLSLGDKIAFGNTNEQACCMRMNGVIEDMVDKGYIC